MCTFTLICSPRCYASDRYGLLITVGGVGGDFSQTARLQLQACRLCRNGGSFRGCITVQTFKEAESSVLEFTVVVC